MYSPSSRPPTEELLEAAGRENVTVLYASNELTLVLSVPSNVRRAGVRGWQMLVVKNEKTPPVHFRLDGESAFVESENGRVCMEFSESPEEKRRVYTAAFTLRARQLRDVDSKLFPSGGASLISSWAATGIRTTSRSGPEYICAATVDLGRARAHGR